MLGNLSSRTQDELLHLVSMIVSRPESELSARDATELDQINTELKRRLLPTETETLDPSPILEVGPRYTIHDWLNDQINGAQADYLKQKGIPD